MDRGWLNTCDNRVGLGLTQESVNLKKLYAPTRLRAAARHFCSVLLLPHGNCNGKLVSC